MKQHLSYNIRLSSALVETVNDLVDAKGNQNEKAVLEAEIELLSAELENLETYSEFQNEKKEIVETKVHILQAKMQRLESEINEVEHQNFDDSKSDALDRA